MDVSILPTAASLLFIFPLSFSFFPYCLSIRNLGRFRFEFNSVTLTYARKNNIYMHVAHTRQNVIASFRVLFEGKDWIFLKNFMKGVGKFILISAALGQHCNAINRFREINGGELDILAFYAYCVANLGAMKFRNGYNITHNNFFFVCSIFPLHEFKRADALFFISIHVIKNSIAGQVA